MKEYVRQQYDYHSWANQKVCAYLQELPQEICHQEIQSVFPTLYDVLVHLYVVDSGWLSILSSGGMAEMTAENIEQLKASTDRFISETKGKSIADMADMLGKLSEKFMSFLDQLQDMNDLCSYGPFQARYADLVQHIVNHGAYHRGNMTAMLRQLGYPGTPTDYSLYLYTRPQ